VLVACDQLGLAGAGQDRLGLGRLAGLARLDFEDFDGGQAQRLARSAGPFGVVARQRRLGRRAQLADADQRDAQSVG
jgi:hypothetical protein